jgi:hypothetical protein
MVRLNYKPQIETKNKSSNSIIIRLPCSAFHSILTLDKLKHGWVLFEHQMRCISTVIQNHVRLPVLRINTSIYAPPEIFFRFTSPGENGES